MVFTYKNKDELELLNSCMTPEIRLISWLGITKAIDSEPNDIVKKMKMQANKIAFGKFF